jgi:hypothetical protein
MQDGGGPAVGKLGSAPAVAHQEEGGREEEGEREMVRERE